MGKVGKPARYIVKWRVIGCSTIIASSKEEAAFKFNEISAEDMIREGYDDITYDTPETEDQTEEE